MSLPRVQLANNGFPLPHAAKTLPASTVGSIYSIQGGTVELMQIWGVVTTAIQAQLNNMKLQYKPTGIAAIDLCAVADINGLLVGQMVAPLGVLATALQIGWMVLNMSPRPLLTPGTIDVSTSATSTGAFRWGLIYLPRDPGAFMTAV